MAKKILITGSCGFIFSNFVLYSMQKTDYDLVSIDKLTYAGKYTNLPLDATNNKRHNLHIGDVCDEHFVNKIFELEKPDYVIHAAAESHVDNSIKDPSIFIKTNVIGTQNMLNAALRVHTPEKFINISCYDQETKAVTKNGLKRFDEIKNGDIVFTLNEKTKKVEEQKIEKIIIQDYFGEMIHFKKPGIDILVSPNHRMYDDKMSICEAVDCLNENVFKFPISTGVNSDKNESIKIGDKFYPAKELFYLIGIFIGDGFTAYQEKKIINKSGLDKRNFIKSFRNTKTGRFVKTTRVGENDYSISKAWRIFLDIPENDKSRNKLEKVLRSLGINYKAQKNKSGEHIYFTSKDFLVFFEQFGKGSSQKHVPSWMMDYSNDCLYELFDGLIGSDGSYLDKTVVEEDRVPHSYKTISNKLKDDICEISIKLGYIPNVSYKYSEGYIKNRKVFGNAWVINFTRHKDISNRFINQIFNYNGKIWCITVKNKNFLVERNGSYIFSGNTDEVYGSIEYGHSLETDKLDPRSPYSASKASADLLGQSYFTTYSLPIITTRCSNIFGSRQDKEKFIPKIIDSVLNKKYIPVYGDGKQMRDWLYVQAKFDAIMTLIEKGEIGQIYNIGADHGIENIEIVNMICDIMEFGHELITYVEDRKGHDRRYSVNCDKLKALGWKNKYDFYEALKHTISWYKSNKWFK